MSASPSGTVDVGASVGEAKPSNVRSSGWKREEVMGQLRVE